MKSSGWMTPAGAAWRCCKSYRPHVRAYVAEYHTPTYPETLSPLKLPPLREKKDVVCRLLMCITYARKIYSTMCEGMGVRCNLLIVVTLLRVRIIELWIHKLDWKCCWEFKCVQGYLLTFLFPKRLRMATTAPTEAEGGRDM